MDGWQDEYLTMIEDCTKREDRMTDWEVQFVASIRLQLSQGKRLTYKQVDALDSVWEKVTSRG